MKKLINKLKYIIAMKGFNSVDIYNSNIYKSGLRKLLIEYKEIISESGNEDKLKQINFHIKILNDLMEELEYKENEGD